MVRPTLARAQANKRSRRSLGGNKHGKSNSGHGRGQGRVGGVGRTITEQLLKQGKAVRAMVRNEDEPAQALRDMGAEVMIGDLLDLDSMHRVIAGCETMYFGMSVSDAYLAATVNAAAVAKHHGVKAFINMSQMTVSQMSITATTPSPQHKLHWLAEQILLCDVRATDQRAPG